MRVRTFNRRWGQFDSLFSSLLLLLNASQVLPMQTIISAGMLPQPFDSSASCGLRRDCLRYPNHEGFNGKLRCRFLMSRFDMSDGAGVCLPSAAQHFQEAARRDIHLHSSLRFRWRVSFCSLLRWSSGDNDGDPALVRLVYHLRLEVFWNARGFR